MDAVSFFRFQLDRLVRLEGTARSDVREWESSAREALAEDHDRLRNDLQAMAPPVGPSAFVSAYSPPWRTREKVTDEPQERSDIEVWEARSRVAVMRRYTIETYGALLQQSQRDEILLREVLLGMEVQRRNRIALDCKWRTLPAKETQLRERVWDLERKGRYQLAVHFCLMQIQVAEARRRKKFQVLEHCQWEETLRARWLLVQEEQSAWDRLWSSIEPWVTDMREEVALQRDEQRQGQLELALLHERRRAELARLRHSREHSDMVVLDEKMKLLAAIMRATRDATEYAAAHTADVETPLRLRSHFDHDLEELSRPETTFGQLMEYQAQLEASVSPKWRATSQRRHQDPATTEMDDVLAAARLAILTHELTTTTTIPSSSSSPSLRRNDRTAPSSPLQQTGAMMMSRYSSVVRDDGRRRLRSVSPPLWGSSEEDEQLVEIYNKAMHLVVMDE